MDVHGWSVQGTLRYKATNKPRFFFFFISFCILFFFLYIYNGVAMRICLFPSLVIVAVNGLYPQCVITSILKDTLLKQCCLGSV